MMKFQLRLFCVIALIVTAPICAVAGEHILQYEASLFDEADYCIPSSEFLIDGIPLNIKIQETEEALGLLQGGYLNNDWPSYTFGTLKIDTCYNNIASITATDENRRTPSGIQVGQTRDELFKLLGFPIKQ